MSPMTAEPLSKPFRVHSDFEPAGDQSEAINRLAEGFNQKGYQRQTLKGVTGSGKTFTMAKLIEKLQRPTLVLSHNKTLAAQLYREFKTFFPENAVEYFVSYYDYYQPEAYVPSRDLYIEKDAAINEEIERLRLSATSSLLDRDDVIVVSTVSCIYGIGNPDSFKQMRLSVRVGKEMEWQQVAARLVSMQYKRNQLVLERGTFRIRGDVLEIFPAYLQLAYRIEWEWETVASIVAFDPLTMERLQNEAFVMIYPATHFVMPEAEVRAALADIEAEMRERVAWFESRGQLLEAERLKSRTEYDLEMMRELGYCTGIENYSRHLDKRRPGQRPACLLDYFPDSLMVIADESHVTLPQIGGMFAGDRSRKQNLVDFGFRLPSALDNRPLIYEEFDALVPRLLYVSATPGKEELQRSSAVVEQVIRPTGLLDPEISVRPTTGQMEDVYGEITACIAAGERVLMTTLTKKMAESVADYLSNLGIHSRYMHSDIETVERVEILKELRMGRIDVLVGINLLREGLDLPEVALVVVFDADKIGFLRSATSLIQTIGRAARNVNGKVILYADRISDAMKTAIDETNRRRAIQSEYNRKYGIEPKSIIKKIEDILPRQKESTPDEEANRMEAILSRRNLLNAEDKKKAVRELEQLMAAYAQNLEFEAAAAVRDTLKNIAASLPASAGG